MLAAQNGLTALVTNLLANGADVNQTTGIGETALMRAARNGHETVVATLIEAKADVNSHQVSVSGSGAPVTNQTSEFSRIRSKNGNHRHSQEDF